MIPVQYRDAETEEVLEGRYESSAPEIGVSMTLDGVGQVRVLYRWRCNPSACVVYVRRASQRERVAA